jgi:hypothetical protein
MHYSNASCFLQTQIQMCEKKSGFAVPRIWTPGLPTEQNILCLLCEGFLSNMIVIEPRSHTYFSAFFATR